MLKNHMMQEERISQMLNCKVDPKALKENDVLCGDCKICAGKSRLDYPFEKDLRNSDDFVRELMAYITQFTRLKCSKTIIDKNPDINVWDDDGSILCRVEAKYLEGQAFMKAKSKIGLFPKEALVVDVPKLVSYVACKENDRKMGKDVPIFVVWKFDRPCKDVGGITVFQEIDTLDKLRRQYGRQRAYEREPADNDFNNGAKFGITDKYHFSIRECERIETLPDRINALKGDRDEANR